METIFRTESLPVNPIFVIERSSGSFLFVVATNLDGSSYVFDQTGGETIKSRQELTELAMGKRLLLFNCSAKPSTLSFGGRKFSVEYQIGKGAQEFSFPIFNYGSEVLPIPNGMFSCGCTERVDNHHSVPRNGFAEIRLRIDLSGASPSRKTIKWLMFSNDMPRKPEDIEINVVSKISLEPGFLQLGSIYAYDKPREIALYVTREHRSNSFLRIVRVDLGRGVKWLGEVENNNRPGVKLRLDVHESNPNEFGFFEMNALFAIEGVGVDRELHGFTATGKKKNSIEVVPASMYVGRVRNGELVTRTFRWTSKNPGSAFVGIAQPEYVKARILGNDLEIELTAPETPSQFETSVLLVVGSESVSVPIVGQLLPYPESTEESK